MDIISNNTYKLFPTLLAEPPQKNILISSMALGGAEKIMLDFINSEVNRRPIEIALLYSPPREWIMPKHKNLKVIRRGNESVQNFVDQLASRWEKQNCLTHLIGDNELNQLMDKGVKVSVTIHNAKKGWKNNLKFLNHKNLLNVVSVSDNILLDILAENESLPTLTIKHKPLVKMEAFNQLLRINTRKLLNVGDKQLLICMTGSFKEQKNYIRALEIMEEVLKIQDAILVISGGTINKDSENQLQQFISMVGDKKLAKNVRLPGFTDSTKYFAAADVFLNTSHFEGLSIATQEALTSNLPSIVSRVNGQTEIKHNLLELFDLKNSNSSIAKLITRHNVRKNISNSADNSFNFLASKLWSLSDTSQQKYTDTDKSNNNTLFITSNLNSGGAQRSLVNLLTTVNKNNNKKLNLCVCGSSSEIQFSQDIIETGINTFIPSDSSDVVLKTEGILKFVGDNKINQVVFWSVDPKIKVLLSKFLPKETAIVDVSPGRYSFIEMNDTEEFNQAHHYGIQKYYDRLDQLIMKHEFHPEDIPKYIIKDKVSYIYNGVNQNFNSKTVDPEIENHKFLVSGRIAPSKGIETILEAFDNHNQYNQSNCLKDSQLHIYGNCEARHQKYYQELISHYSQKNVFWHGADYSLEYLKLAWTSGIVLGQHQGCPNTVLEYGSASIPVIANDSGGTKYVMEKLGGSILLKEEFNASSLFKAMNKITKNYSTYKNQAKNSNKKFKDFFSVDKMANSYIKALSIKEIKKIEHNF